jgi:hypothetical protein
MMNICHVGSENLTSQENKKEKSFGTISVEGLLHSYEILN